jgi:deoxyribonuclease V
VNTKLLHPWCVEPAEARKIQNKLKKHVVFAPFERSHYTVAGIDVSYKRSSREACAAIVVMSYPVMSLKEISIARISIDFPYISGLLAFREAPAVLEAWKKLKSDPDLLLFDAQGIAHPVKFGLASHLGLLLDKPSIGCAKDHLFGNYIEPDKGKWSFSYLTDPKDNSQIGAVMRTRSNVNCVYTSVGYKMDLNSAIKAVFALIGNHRIPEPLKQAHNYSKKGWE